MYGGGGGGGMVREERWRERGYGYGKFINLGYYPP